MISETSKPEGRFGKAADGTLLRKVTDGYRPKISLRQGIEEMIELVLLLLFIPGRFFRKLTSFPRSSLTDVMVDYLNEILQARGSCNTQMPT